MGPECHGSIGSCDGALPESMSSRHVEEACAAARRRQALGVTVIAAPHAADGIGLEAPSHSGWMSSQLRRLLLT